MIFFIVVIFSFVPGGARAFGLGDSYASGIGILSVFLILLNAMNVVIERRRGYILSHGVRPYGLILLTLFIVGHFFLVDSTESGMFDHERFYWSLLLLCIMFAGATSLANTCGRLDERAINKIGWYLFGCHLIMVATSLLGIYIWDVNIYPKPVGAYSEPSHYALVLAPFALYLASVSRLSTKIMVLISVLFVGLVMESLLMLVGALLISALTFRVRWTICFCIFTGVVTALFFQADYYLGRLVYTDDIRNLSVLVYVKGWETTWFGIVETGGLGWGFQQLGISNTYDGLYAGEILRQTSVILNEKDGGFLAAKIISEFGVMGALFSLFFVSLCVKSSLCIISFSEKRRLFHSVNTNGESGLVIMCHSVVACFPLELILRGGNYFTTGTLMFTAASVYLLKKERPDIFKWLVPFCISAHPSIHPSKIKRYESERGVVAESHCHLDSCSSRK